MPDRPIIFSAPMVRALIEGRKTQTRRVLRNQPVPEARFHGFDRDGLVLFTVGCFYGKERLPYAPGDRLYVREAWSINATGGSSIGGVGDWGYNLEFRAGGFRSLRFSGDYTQDPYMRLFDTQVGDWRPSIHMPRWASRLTLTVTDVRVQRVQDISEADAIAEGMPGRPKEFMDTTLATSRWWFRDLWNSLHGPEAWDDNPWVAAVSFTVEQRNIDAKEARDA